VKITLDAKADVPTLTVEGDIGHDDLPLFGEALADAAGQAGDRVVLDLAGVTHLESADPRVIDGLTERLRESRGVEIVGLPPQLDHLFHISGLVRAWTRTFPSDLGELEKIRGLVEAFGTMAGLGDARVYDLKVAVSEAAANAIEHGSCDGVLTVQGDRSPDRLTVTVSSPGAFKPRAGNDPARGHRGMGLPLILALLDEVTITNLRDGGARVTLSMLVPEAS
jgi:serine/threonine-protein kinase RsbW